MKTRFKFFWLIAFLQIFPIGSCFSQTAVATILNEPCNLNDGVVAVEVSGLALPINYPITYIYHGWNFDPIIHTGVYSAMDTAFNLSSCFGVQVILGNGQGNLNGQIIMYPPFTTYWPIIVNPVCPDTMGTVEIVLSTGSPTSVEWFEYDTLNGMGSFLSNDNPATFSSNFSYIAVVEDGSGCSVFSYPVLGANAGDSAHFVPQSDIDVEFLIDAADCTDGEIEISSISGGLPPYTYLWNNGLTTTGLSGLVAGSYGLEITDSNGCILEEYAYVGQTAGIVVQSDVTDATCLENDGSAIAFGVWGASPYTYQWSNGTVGQSIQGVPGGTYYQVVVTDANGCWGQGGAYVDVSTPITVTNAVTPSSCSSTDGAVTLTISNGTPPYEVTWATFPQQTGVTATGLAVGNYNFVVEDADGCLRTGTVQIPSIGQLSGHLSATHVTCPDTDGNITAVVNGTNPPFTFLWNNGSTAQSLNMMPPGSYNCTITDSDGCSIIKYGSINSYSPLNVGVSTTNASCIYTCDGTAFANATGGTPPYTYSWGAQSTSNLCPGYYHVQVMDADGCYGGRGFPIGYDVNSDDCYCTIKGKVYEDQNGNCQYDFGEPPMNNVMIYCQGWGYKFTDAQGNYSFKVPIGSYTITENIQAFYPLAPCQSNHIPVEVTATGSGCQHIVDFANAINPIHDIRVTHAEGFGPPIPGNPYRLRAIVKNAGTITETGIIMGYEHDGQLQYDGSGPFVSYNQQNPGAFPDWFSITSGFPTLTAGNTTVVNTNYTVPTNIPLGTEVVFHDTATYESPMSTWLDDFTPWDNTNQIEAVVVASYDPNYVEVHPRGEEEPGYIERADTTLDYVIHFQNTGTYYAQNIFILDTLDGDLDILSFVPGYSDHSYEVEISEDRVAKFTFENIHLPWQEMTEYGSRGLVTYSIRQLPNLPFGTEINTTAAIFFDYNQPVITNTTRNTIVEQVGVVENKPADKMILFPNPTTGLVNFKLPANRVAPKTVVVYDMQGREVYSTAYQASLDVSFLKRGSYVISVVADEYTHRQILVVER